MKRKSSILLDFLLIVIFVMVSLISMITYLNISSKKKAVIKEVSNTSNNISSALSELSRKAITYGRLNVLDKSVEALRQREDSYIKEINIFVFENETDVRIIYSSNPDNIGITYEMKGLKKTLIKNGYWEGENTYTTVESDKKLKTYDFYSLISDRDKPIGVYNSIYSLDKIYEENNKILIANAMIAVISIVVVIIFTTLMLLNRVYNPIQKLIKEVRKIKDGEIAYEVQLKVNNELSSLAEEINEMKSSIWENTVDDRMANPITGLPGLMTAIEKINDKIDDEEFFSLLTISLVNLKPYVVKNGIPHGEGLLRFFCQCARDTLEEVGIKESTFVQVREELFFLIIDPEKALETAKALVEKFDEEVLDHYNEDEREKLQINIKNAQLQDVSFPVASILVGIIDNKIRGEITGYKELEERIMELELESYNNSKGSRFLTYEELKKGYATLKEEDGSAEESNESDDGMENLEGLEDEFGPENLGDEESGDGDEEDLDLLDGLDELEID